MGIPNAIALADAYVLLATAHETNGELTTEELHCVCYFGRMVSSALNDASLPYQFTYGAHGGPYSKSIQDGLDYIVTQGIVARSLEDRDPIVATYHTDPSLSDYLADLPMEDGFAHGGACVAAVAHAMRTRPLPIVFNTIHYEPNLLLARTEHLQVGLPLDDKLQLFGEWLRTLAAQLDRALPGRGREPEVIIPATLDVLAEHYLGWK